MATIFPVIYNYYDNNATAGQSQGGTAASGELFQACGQGFIPGREFRNITQIGAKLFVAGAPTDNMTIEIRQGTQTGTLIATSNTVAASSIVSNNEQAFTFTAFSLGSGVKYYMNLMRSGARDITNYIIWLGNNSDNVYKFGGITVRSNNAWDAESTTIDAAFIIYSSDPNAIKLPRPTRPAPFRPGRPR